MFNLPRISVFALAAILPGCALTPERREQVTRQRHYQQLLAKVKPGMTRRQLYSILPPKSVPVATPLHCWAIISLPQFWPLRETHPLDADFSLETQYRVAKMSEYPSPWAGSTRPFALRGTSTMPSRQNSRDELLARPSLAGPGVKTVVNIAGDGSLESLVVDPRQLKLPKSRPAPVPKNAPRLSR
jgi:hypothetical protein